MRVYQGHLPTDPRGSVDSLDFERFKNVRACRREQEDPRTVCNAMPTSSGCTVKLEVTVQP